MSSSRAAACTAAAPWDAAVAASDARRCIAAQQLELQRHIRPVNGPAARLWCTLLAVRAVHCGRVDAFPIKGQVQAGEVCQLADGSLGARPCSRQQNVSPAALHHVLLQVAAGEMSCVWSLTCYSDTSLLVANV